MLIRKISHKYYGKASSSRGFTLIEILITLVILSIGLLGVAALQLKSLQGSHASYERSVVTLQSRDLVERMWAGICSVYDEEGDFIPNGEQPIWSAWLEDHTNMGTFRDQRWVPVLSPPLGGTNIWTITINWEGRNQGQPETIVHRFSLPPPLNPDTCEN